MSGATKFSAAAILSLLLIIGLVFFLMMTTDRNGALDVGLDARRAATGGVTDAVRSGEGSGDPGAEVADEASALDAEEIALAPDPRLVRGRWLLTGRVVTDDGGELVPAANVTAYFRPHPRRTPSELAPPPQRSVTGRDGRFAFVAVPGSLWLRLEVDAAEKAYRTISFRLPDPEWKGHRDLGDIVLEPGQEFRMKIIGPRDEPVVGAEVLVGRRKNERSVSLEKADMKESRRLARDLGGGEYLLERAAPGPLRVQVRASGYARFREYVDVPSTGAVVIQLERGLSISGTVQTLEGEPIAAAELEIDGPNIGSPLPVITADESGRFIFDVLSSGEYDVTVRADRFVELEEKDVTAGVEEVVFALARESVASGTVVAADGGDAVEGARVRLTSATGDSFEETSGADGSFRVGRLAEGIYVVAIEHESFAPFLEPDVEVPAETTLEARRFELDRGLAATGVVQDGERVTPVHGAVVRMALRSNAGGLSIDRKTETDADGRFRLEGLVEGEYDLAAKAEAYLTGDVLRVAVVDGEENDFEVTLARGASVGGRVLDSEGRPVAAATIDLLRPPTTAPRVSGQIVFSSSSATPRKSTLSEADGRYEIVGIPAGSAYRLSVSHRDFPPASSDAITLEQGQSLIDLDIVLDVGGAVAGRVVGGDGRPMAAVRVTAIQTAAISTGDPDGDPGTAGAAGASATTGAASVAPGAFVMQTNRPRTVRTDGDGRFTIDHLTPGVYTVTTQATGYVSSSVEDINVERGATTDGIELVLDRGESLAGLVTDADGRPLAGAEVRPRGGSVSRVRTDLDGQFRVEGLPPGKISVEFSKTGFVSTQLDLTAPQEDIAVVLEVAATIVGTVTVRGRGEPVDGAMVALRYPPTAQRSQSIGGMSSSPRFPRTRTRADGSFDLDDVWEGDFELVVTHSTYSPATVPVAGVRPGEVREVSVELGAGGAVRGVVTGGGDPLPGAMVHLQPRGGSGPGLSKSSRADVEGRYEVTGLAPGDYILMARPGSPEPFIAATEQLTIVGEAQVVVDVDLKRAIVVTGLVTSGGTPLAGARLTVYDPAGGRQPASARVDATGRYQVFVPGAGTYVAHVRASGGSWGTSELFVPGGTDVVELDIELPTGRIVGVVVDASSGAPVPSAQVMVGEATTTSGASGQRTLMAAFRSMRGAGRTAASGRFAVPHVAEGTYSLRVVADGYIEEIVEGIEVRSGRDSREVRVELRLGGTVRARVVDGSGRAVTGAIGLLRDASGNLAQIARPAISDRNGQMRITGVPAGRHEIAVVHTDHAPGRFTVDVDVEEVETVFRLERGGEVGVLVVDARGAPVAGASLQVLDESGVDLLSDRDLFVFAGRGEGARVTGEDGRVALDRVPRGTHRVVASKDGRRSAESRVDVAADRPADVKLTLR